MRQGWATSCEHTGRIMRLTRPGSARCSRWRWPPGPAETWPGRSTTPTSAKTTSHWSSPTNLPTRRDTIGGQRRRKLRQKVGVRESGSCSPRPAATSIGDQRLTDDHALAEERRPARGNWMWLGLSPQSEWSSNWVPGFLQASSERRLSGAVQEAAAPTLPCFQAEASTLKSVFNDVATRPGACLSTTPVSERT